MTTPDYLFECSWEVCNKVGGIYTVLSSKALTLHDKFNDNMLFTGPDLDNDPPDFEEDKSLFKEWTSYLPDRIRVKTGRWKIPGNPPVILVTFNHLYVEKNALYYDMWEHFGVDSYAAYGNYDESCIFAYSAGLAIEDFYRFYKLENKKVAIHFNEWTLGMGALYIRKNVPQMATLFTTHATTTGRSIASNNKPLYGKAADYNGDKMAAELGVQAKHSLEKQTAKYVDCFTTVSDITSFECKQFLGKQPDIVTPNGFENGFVPTGKEYEKKRVKARKTLLNVVEKLTGSKIGNDAFLIATSGRYEYRNKGLDVFIEVMNSLRKTCGYYREIVAYIMVPGWVYAARADLKYLLENDDDSESPLQTPILTHWLNNENDDRIVNYIRQSGFTNAPDEKVKIIFVPCYIDGQDGIFNKSYYDLLVGMDATVFASYYEPWGYTPLESISFGIPTITTQLAGFGAWCKSEVSGDDITEGVAVVNRNEDNYFEVVNEINKQIIKLINLNMTEVRENCLSLAEKARWKHFINYYYKAYEIAFERQESRNQEKI
ncbi:MAG: glycogen/starch synthase [Tannerella sp.]|jgi:glycosyltransferase involved in cell wall biosynthesis|nr:glycogen/starch synthase [Tannerella sp.]